MLDQQYPILFMFPESLGCIQRPLDSTNQVCDSPNHICIQRFLPEHASIVELHVTLPPGKRTLERQSEKSVTSWVLDKHCAEDIIAQLAEYMHP